jgi:hypothetical protein
MTFRPNSPGGGAINHRARRNDLQAMPRPKKEPEVIDIETLPPSRARSSGVTVFAAATHGPRFQSYQGRSVEGLRNPAASNPNTTFGQVPIFASRL